MRLSMLALAGAAMLFAAPAFAEDDVMSNTYGNTITTKDMKTGATSTLMFSQDGTYAGNTGGQAYTGKWTLSGGNICLAPTGQPASAPGDNCSPVVKHAVGETWTVTNDKGGTYQVSLTAGR